jgi:hypothetical protein
MRKKYELFLAALGTQKCFIILKDWLIVAFGMIFFYAVAKIAGASCSQMEDVAMVTGGCLAFMTTYSISQIVRIMKLIDKNSDKSAKDGESNNEV